MGRVRGDQRSDRGDPMTTTRRQFLTYSSAFVATSAVALDALAQSGLVGALDGSEVITDPAAVPHKFQEAPELAELVRQGKLPPVAQRLPEEPLVLKPLN